MHRSSLRVTVLAAVLGLVGAVAPAATASSGAPSGPLLLESGNDSIVSTSPTSGTFRALADGAWPSASPDGQSVALVPPSTRADFRRDLAVLDRSSGAVRTVAVARPGRAVGQSSWSPDSRQIVFESAFGLSVVDLASGRARTLTTPGAEVYDGDPSWSADGSRIAFTRTSGTSGEVKQIFTVRPDGSGLRLLTTGSNPDFSPTGAQLLFLRGTDAVHVVGRDGGTGRRLFTLAAGADYAVDAVWSPDGRRVAVQQPAYDDPNVCDCTRIRIHEPSTARSWWGTPELFGGTQFRFEWAPRPR